MAIREGRWDCPSCGDVAQLGRNVHCTQCGSPRPQDVRFYLPEDAAEVTDAERLAEANAGPDWVCEHCGSSARATDLFCPGCGAERGGSAGQKVVEYGMDDMPRSGRPAATPRPLAAAAVPAKKSHFGRNVLVLVAAVFSYIGWSGRTQHVQAVLTAKEWDRTVQVEEYRTVAESDWSVPAGGTQTRSYRAIRDYRQVLDHYETRQKQVSERVQVGTETYTCGTVSKGNGYFEDRTCTRPEYETRYHTESYQEPIYRREPVWDTKYDYRIKRWLPDTLLRAHGDTTSPAWPVATVDATHREGQKKETYVLVLRDDKGKSYTADVPLAQFTAPRIGQPLPILLTRGKVQIDTAATH